MNNVIFNRETRQFAPGEHADNGYEPLENARHQAEAAYEDAVALHVEALQVYQGAYGKLERARSSEGVSRPVRVGVAAARYTLARIRLRGRDSRLRLADAEWQSVKQAMAGHPSSWHEA